MAIKSLIPLLVFFSLFSYGAENEWIPVKITKDGIKAEKREAPITKVATIIFDTKRAPEWIEYDHVFTPPIIMKDRDFVSKVKLTIDAKSKTITFLYLNTTVPEMPETSYIRGDLMNTTFVLKSIDNDQHTNVVGEIHCDPKGSVAKWLVKNFQSDWPIDTIKNLRKQAAKPDVKDDEKIMALFNSATVTNTDTTIKN